MSSQSIPRSQSNTYLSEVEQAERDRRIWQLRLEGKSQRAIASEIGISQTRVHEILTQMVKDHASEDVEKYLQIQLSRLELVSETAWQMVQDEYFAHGNGRIVVDSEGHPLTDISPKLQAMTKYIEALKEVNKLRGLYAPEKKQVESTVNIDPKVSELIGLMNNEETA